MKAGMSQNFSQQEYEGELAAAPVVIRASADAYLSRQTALYLEYMRGPWRFDAEFRASKTLVRIWGPPPLPGRIGRTEPAWYIAASYRLSRLAEIGAYRSQYKYQELFDPLVAQAGPGSDHIHDSVVTLRLDPTTYWNIKLEGHFIDGVGNGVSARGFYPRYHPQGAQPDTNMLVVRTGFVF
jgi:hypothetical protein